MRCDVILVIAMISDASAVVIAYPAAYEEGNGLGFEQIMDPVVEVSCLTSPVGLSVFDVE